MNTTRSWVFLGDSLTEGVGSSRVSYVTELAEQLRQAESQQADATRHAVHEFRLRRVDPDGFNPFVRYNIAGMWTRGTIEQGGAIWLWNLASEGTTLEADFEWLPFLESLRPSRIFIFRGSLESVIRPAALRDGNWPWWVPRSWRNYAAMDPRCYFSSTWWRRAKQASLDCIKQKTRHSLLARHPGTTLMDAERIVNRYRDLIHRLNAVTDRISVLGLLPIDDEKFPGTSEQFHRVNEMLRDLADAGGAEFIDWGARFQQSMQVRSLFYLDGFHPNQTGAQVLAGVLFARLADEYATR